MKKRISLGVLVCIILTVCMTVGVPVWGENQTVYLDAPCTDVIAGAQTEIHNMNLMPASGNNLVEGDVIKLAYYMNISAIDNEDGDFNFSPLLQRNDGSWTTVGSGGLILYYEDFEEYVGKNIIIVFVMQLIEGYDEAIDAVSPRLFASEGIHFKLDRFVIAGADYDFGTSADYLLVVEEECDSGDVAVENEWTPSTQANKPEETEEPTQTPEATEEPTQTPEATEDVVKPTIPQPTETSAGSDVPSQSSDSTLKNDGSLWIIIATIVIAVLVVAVIVVVIKKKK